jgi:hypothetical protein
VAEDMATEIKVTTSPIVASVVVLGAMTPAIHSPEWYRLLGAITDEEAQAAIKSEIYVVMHQLSRFVTAGMVFTCTDDRWEISAISDAARPRIIKIASVAFARLMDTPLTAYGFNNNFDRPTSVPNVKAFLAERIASAGFKPPADGDRAAQLSFQAARPFQQTGVTIQGSKTRNDWVLITYNAHYDLEPQDGFYDPTPMMRTRFEMARRDAVSYADEIVSRINEMKGE